MKENNEKIKREDIREVRKNECRSLLIKDREDYKKKIKIVYEKWGLNGFTKEWFKTLENRWCPSTDVWEFLNLLKAKRELSEKEYTEKEEVTIKYFEKTVQHLRKFMSMIETENEAFKKAGIKEGRVKYKCPICGGVAIANRYTYGGRRGGLGSGCPKCGISHS